MCVCVLTYSDNSVIYLCPVTRHGDAWWRAVVGATDY